MESIVPWGASAPSARVTFDRHAVRRLNELLVDYARRRVRADEVDDVVQATWAAALRGGHDGRGTLEGYLLKILRRRIVDRYRERSRIGALAFEPLAPPDAQRASAARAELERVSADWHHLPPREARALELISVGEHDHEEAAEALGVSRVHFRVLVHRARTRLRATVSRNRAPTRTTAAP